MWFFTAVTLFSSISYSWGFPLVAGSPGQSATSIESQESRHTLEQIIWSCFATIFACMWIAVHPSVPNKLTSSRWPPLKRCAIMMASAIVTPEFMVLWAIREKLIAVKIIKEYNRRLHMSHHGFLFILWCNYTLIDIHLGEVRRLNHLQGQAWTLTHGFFLLMNGFVLYNDNGDPMGPLIPAILFHELDSSEIGLPITVSKEEIQDKSKGDFFTKLIVVTQTTWFTIQCFSCTATGLPLMALEVVTLTFAMLNGFTYAMWWHKPQNVDVSVPVILSPWLQAQVSRLLAVNGSEALPMNAKICDNGPLNEVIHPPFCFISKMHEMVRKWDGMPSFLGSFFQAFMFPFNMTGDAHLLSKLPSSSNFTATSHELLVLSSWFALTVMFDGLHLLWLACFGSSTEAHLWCVSAALCSLMSLVWLLTSLLHHFCTCQSWRPSTSVWVYWKMLPFSLLLLPAYFFAWLVLFVVALSSLHSLPSGAFVDVGWSKYIPHLH